MPTAQRILDIAEELVQTRGFNAFSYADIAEAMNITKASLHYHFASKSDLGARLIVRYEANFMAALDAVTAGTEDGGERLRRYAGLWINVLRSGRMCLCGVLAAEVTTLAPPMRLALQQFMDRHEDWLCRVLEEGLARGELTFDGAPREMAGLVIGALEGTMIMARAHDDVDRFAVAIRRMLRRLGVAWQLDESVAAAE